MNMLSIIVPWRDRQELAHAIGSIAARAIERGGTVHVINFGGDRAALDQQIGEHAPQVQVVDVRCDGWFNKAVANNVGAAVVPGDMLFFCDCDIIMPAAAAELFDRVAAEQGVFGTIAGVRESRPNAREARNLACFGYTLHLRLRNGRQLDIVDNEEDAVDGTRQAPGLLCVRRADFESVNGYNGGFEGWGWEDQDMIARLTLGAGLRRIQHGIVTHLSHDDSARTRHHPPQFANRWESRDRMFRQALANYDDDCFEGTYRRDAAAWAGQKPL